MSQRRREEPPPWDDSQETTEATKSTDVSADAWQPQQACLCVWTDGSAPPPRLPTKRPATKRPTCAERSLSSYLVWEHSRS